MSWRIEDTDEAVVSPCGPDRRHDRRETLITDEELRMNHEVVSAFETLRKRHGYREMNDAALRDIAESTGVKFETLRVARHLRNAVAHGETVNREILARYQRALAEALGESRAPEVSALAKASAFRPHAYRIHAWQDARLEQEMIANGFVSVGGPEIGDLTDVDDAEFIRAWLTKSMPDKTANAIAIFVGYWRRFLRDAVPGDIVVLPMRDRRVAIGEFVGPYFYVPNEAPRARHRRSVDWFASVDHEAFGPDLAVTLIARHTVQEFKAPDAPFRLKAIADTGLDPGPASPTA